jgi:hypothetical protein
VCYVALVVDVFQCETNSFLLCKVTFLSSLTAIERKICHELEFDGIRLMNIPLSNNLPSIYHEGDLPINTESSKVNESNSSSIFFFTVLAPKVKIDIF